MASMIASWCDLELKGQDIEINCVAPYSEELAGSLCFASAPPAQSISSNVVLISTIEAESFTNCLLVTDRPRLTFARILNVLQQRIGFQKSPDSPIIHPTARVSAQAYVAAGAVIGARTVVLPFAYIGEDTVIGADCVIKSGSVIGQDGFGFERDEENLPVRIPHLGRVLIGDCVEIGALNTICRGTLGDTLIDDHVKTDDHVHIAHNCHIKKGVLLTACVELSGGVKIGEFSWVGPNSSVIQKKNIGRNAFVGIATNVTKDVPDNAVVAGNPSKVIRFQ